MKFVRSDSPEFAREIASARTLARRNAPIFLLGLLPNLTILLIALVSLIFSMWVAAFICLPAFLAWNAWAIWRARSPRLSWVVKTGLGRVYIRLYVGFGRAWRRTDVPDVLVLEVSEIASISIRAIEVFVYGPEPKSVEWLVIEPSQAAAEGISNQVPSFLGDLSAHFGGGRFRRAGSLGKRGQVSRCWVEFVSPCCAGLPPAGRTGMPIRRRPRGAF
jgi:hypothetical protein